ncbi:beta-1,3-galactosyltransferase 2-like isoform X2 [Sebastes umbrosus]|nr:beta-1,3-galactosyltransferase 2-like isoform X2 [Sebastes umbrosus]XP_037647123.1 beta-1,3-galactosyltransferase 2-like isoform X2 [Sebastes umbrosus]XP_037647131.1 beta-1,3-galactosyltransferase 2-like isoform X2 [Sebastes umbrosus]XP_037647142.1 beta-1,3-galactosyltransferase 2-like isoform X2 [Sebastes umbrosus]
MEPENRRCCSWSRRQGFLLVLVLAAVLFFYTTDKTEIMLNWSPVKWWIPFKSLRQNVVSGSNTSTPALPHTENIMTTNVTDLTGQTNGSVALTQQIQAPTDPAKPPPYKSPGLYFVEYPNEYHFIINEQNKCEQQKPFLVLMVPVAPSNRAHRDVIRSTWGGESQVLGKVVQLFFLLGRHAGERAQQLHEQLMEESREHRDLIQSDFLDCYKNLTIKTMVMLEWLDSHCSNAAYAMKIDSDMFLNVPKLIEMLLTAPKTNYMTGEVVRGAAVRRDKPSKWFVPVEVYSQAYYPVYTLGLGYVLSLDLPKKLVEASRHVKAFYIEDVYLGMCMQHLGIPYTQSGGYFHVFPVSYSRCAYARLIATTRSENTDGVEVWKDFKRPGPQCP